VQELAPTQAYQILEVIMVFGRPINQ